MTLIEPQIIHSSFTDFEELTETVKLWNMNLNKLDTSPFYGELFQLLTPNLLIGRGKFNSQLKQLGEPPPGFRTFTIPANEDFWMYWRGYQVYGNNLMAFPMGSEIDTVSDPRFDIFTISIKEDFLFQQAASMGFQGLEKLLRKEEVLETHPEYMNRLRSYLHQCADKTRLPCSDAAQMAQVSLVRLIEVLAASSGASITKQASHRRLQAIRETNRFLVTNPEEVPTVRELCKLADVSQRTLEYAFTEHYGVKPKQYINAMRLNRVRKQLIAMRKDQPRIVTAANASGFWHMGQFAKDYRKLFGELPSQTIV